MVMLNDLDRFHLVIDVIDRVPGLGVARGGAAPADGRRAAAAPRVHPRARRGLPRDPRLAVARRRCAGMRVLTVNTGSSSVKLRVLGADDEVLVSRDSTPEDLGADVGDLLEQADAVGHRVVHGGPDHVAPERVTDALVADLRGLTDLAPLHQPVARGRDRGRTPGRARRTGGGLLRHRLPRRPAGRGAHLRPAAGVAGAARAAALRLPRPVLRLRVAPGRRAARPATTCAWSSRTSGREPRWPPCAAGGRWTPRWGSPRWRAW